MYDKYHEIACRRDCGDCSALKVLGNLGGEAVRETLMSNRGSLMFREVDVTPQEARSWASTTLPRMLDREPTEAETDAVSDSVLQTANPNGQCETIFDFLYE